MSFLIDVIENKEKKLRKNWLRLSIFKSFIFPSLFFIVFIAVMAVLYSKASLTINNSISVSNIIYVILTFSFIFIIILSIKGLIFWWIYHCAYKKHGATLLLFFLIVTPLLFFREVFEIFFGVLFKSAYIQKIISLEGMNEHGTALYPIVNFILNSFIIYLFCSCVLIVWWFIWSIKLRKINKKLQALLNPLSPPEKVSNFT